MAQHKGLVGGFVASNTGEIENCYCVTSFNGKKYISGGFVGENKGTISKSFCEYTATGLSGGFSGTRTQLGDGCFFIYDQVPSHGKDAQLWDRKCGLDSHKIHNAVDAAKVGFDMKNIWAFTGKRPLLCFQENRWMFPNAFRSLSAKQVLSIKDVKNLLLFAEMVNNGDIRFINSSVRLDADIDLGGKDWTPIGIERSCAFNGVFDGNGYSITNFVIKDDHCSKKGFFGYLKGNVYNLTLDCQIKGDGCCGGIAAVNEGNIGYCGAVVGLYTKGGDINAGGLVGVNNGRIFQSYAAGKMKFFILPIIPLVVAASSAMMLSAAVFSASSGGGNSIYSPIAKDPHQTQSTQTPEPGTADGTDSEITPSENTQDDSDSNGFTHSLSFTLGQEITVSLSSGECQFYFTNPSGNTNCVILSLVVENEDGTRTEIAHTGAVYPGYRLESATLLEGASLSAGSYSGYAVLTSYDVDTHDKAMVETELPVNLTVTK